MKRAVFLIKKYKWDEVFIPYLDYLISEGEKIYQISISAADDLADFPLVRDTDTLEIEYRSVIHDIFEEELEVEAEEFDFSFPE